jgi:hypothetical protein
MAFCYGCDFSKIECRRKRPVTMIKKVFKKVFGSRNDRLVKKMRKAVAEINAL